MSSWKEFQKTGATSSSEKTKNLGLLVVDDESGIVKAISDVFEDAFVLYPATSAADALRLFREHQPRIVISDQRMPDMTGIELFRQIREINPDTVCILVTGYSDISVVITALNEGLVWKYVTKPWEHEALRQMVAEAAREWLRRAGEDEKTINNFLGS